MISKNIYTQKRGAYHNSISLALLILITSFVFLGGTRLYTETGQVSLYSKTPTLLSGLEKEASTGLALADINGDTYPDIIISNGNDMELQTLAVYYNDGKGNFSTGQMWQSRDYAYNGNLAVGDLNGDGWIDVAVSILLGEDKNYYGGGLKVYYNQKGCNGVYLEDKASWYSQDKYPTFSCAIGDGDGDGDLDLAAAAGEPIPEVESFAKKGNCEKYHPNPKPTGVGNGLPPIKEYGRIYYNIDGKLEGNPGWKSEKPMVAMDVGFLDVDQNGFMDIVFAAPEAVLYLADNNGNISRCASWVSNLSNYFAVRQILANTLHTNPQSQKEAGGSPVPIIVQGNNNYMGGGRGGAQAFCFNSPYILQFEPFHSSPFWHTQAGGWGTDVHLADVNNDGFIDLLTSLWAPEGGNNLGMPLMIYLGNGNTFSTTPDWIADIKSKSVIESIETADLKRSCIKKIEQNFCISLKQPISVLYLQQLQVARVLEVKINNQTLHSCEYCWVPNQNFVSFKKRLKKGDNVKVIYEYSENLDIVITNWNCDKDNYIFYKSDGRCELKIKKL